MPDFEEVCFDLMYQPGEPHDHREFALSEINTPSVPLTFLEFALLHTELESAETYQSPMVKLGELWSRPNGSEHVFEGSRSLREPAVWVSWMSSTLKFPLPLFKG
jgi:hypothetical protein